MWMHYIYEKTRRWIRFHDSISLVICDLKVRVPYRGGGGLRSPLSVEYSKYSYSIRTVLYFTHPLATWHGDFLQGYSTFTARQCFQNKQALLESRQEAPRQ